MCHVASSKNVNVYLSFDRFEICRIHRKPIFMSLLYPHIEGSSNWVIVAGRKQHTSYVEDDLRNSVMAVVVYIRSHGVRLGGSVASDDVLNFWRQISTFLCVLKTDINFSLCLAQEIAFYEIQNFITAPLPVLRKINAVSSLLSSFQHPVL